MNGSPFILVADDVGPADVAEHGDRLAGIALSAGGATAHAAIVARSLGIPMTALAGPELLELPMARGSSSTAATAPLSSSRPRRAPSCAGAASEDRAHARARERPTAPCRP